MKKLLLVSFDLIREGESKTTLSIGSLIATLRQSEFYGTQFSIEHKSINLLSESTTAQSLNELKGMPFGNYDWVAVSAYIWGEKWMRDFLQYLRYEYRYKGIIALGGYQVSYANDEQLVKEYSETDTFIKGYGELGLLKLIQDTISGNLPAKFINEQSPLVQLPSPYLTKVIQLSPNQGMVRMEAKRGCPYKCSFCAHKDNLGNKVYNANLEKVYKEIDLVREKNVGKINFLDPVFNMNGDYLEILKYLESVRFKGKISLQSRPELIAGQKGEQFLRLIKNLDVTLEFGTQTLDEEINKTIKRQNNYKQIFESYRNVREAGVNFEVSLIYGLPGQTLDSFKKDIETLRLNGVTEITAWPLMLLKGTQLYTQKEQFAFREATLGRFHIPHVVESNTFSENDWQHMHKIAVSLNPNSRVY